MRTCVGTTTFVANTDVGWFSHFLYRAEPSDKADSWQPPPLGFRAIPAGVPFFLSLPDNACKSSITAAKYDVTPAQQSPGAILVAR
jgi:hypothetical protein